jgi:hypothetical protein
MAPRGPLGAVFSGPCKSDYSPDSTLVLVSRGLVVGLDLIRFLVDSLVVLDIGGDSARIV